jgi:soluble lytic murein transglycosylase-like protein
LQAAIRRAADATGVNFSLLVETARRESALNPNARAGTSSATGLFQFIDSTWLDMVRRHGADHGLGAEAKRLQNGARTRETPRYSGAAQRSGTFRAHGGRAGA